MNKHRAEQALFNLSLLYTSTLLENRQTNDCGRTGAPRLNKFRRLLLCSSRMSAAVEFRATYNRAPPKARVYVYVRVQLSHSLSPQEFAA